MPCPSNKLDFLWLPRYSYKVRATQLSYCDINVLNIQNKLPRDTEVPSCVAYSIYSASVGHHAIFLRLTLGCPGNGQTEVDSSEIRREIPRHEDAGELMFYLLG